MPTKSKSACTCKGCPSCAGRCPNLVSSGRCAICAPDQQSYKDRVYRNAQRRAIYRTKQWKAIARQVKREQPFCNVTDCTNLTYATDHVIPLRQILEANGDPYDRRNLQGLCAYHHAQKTNAELRAGR